jgi:hypothetical protein
VVFVNVLCSCHEKTEQQQKVDKETVAEQGTGHDRLTELQS